MLIVTAKLSKKKLALVLLAVSALILSILLFFPAPEGSPQQETSPQVLSTNEARLELLSSCGLEAIPEPISTLDLQLPSPLDERYTAYNQLQLQQGVELSAYCGKNLTRYTYAITNYSDPSQ